MLFFYYAALRRPDVLLELSAAALQKPYHLLDGRAIEERLRYVVDTVQYHDFRVSATLLVGKFAR
jgi:hypothetical protein